MDKNGISSQTSKEKRKKHKNICVEELSKKGNISSAIRVLANPTNYKSIVSEKRKHEKGKTPGTFPSPHV